MSVGLFNKKNTNHFCKYLLSSLIFDDKNNIKLCPYSDFGFIQSDFDGIWLDIEKIKKVREKCSEMYKKGDIPSQCSNCSCFSGQKEKKIQSLKYLYLSHWKNCLVNCLYCDLEKKNDLISAHHYDIFPAVNQLVDDGLLTKKTKIIFECGDALIHPEFDKLMNFFVNYGMKNIVIVTPALMYNEQVSKAIEKNMATVIIPFDSGLPFMYEKVKGSTKYYYTAVENIKKYLSVQKAFQKRIILKYTLINGVNDNQKDLLKWFILSRKLGVKKLAVDIDKKWYAQIKNSVPFYLKELIVFIKDVSKYNNFEIEFYDRINLIYKSVNINEIKD